MPVTVSIIPEEPSRDKKESLLFQEGRKSFKAEIVFCYIGVLFLDGYDYKADYRKQIELLAACFDRGSNFDELLQKAGYIKPWEKIRGILMPMGNIPVLIPRYSHDVDKIMQELEEQIRIESRRDFL